jgi:hypothetical protein
MHGPHLGVPTVAGMIIPAFGQGRAGLGRQGGRAPLLAAALADC